MTKLLNANQRKKLLNELNSLINEKNGMTAEFSIFKVQDKFCLSWVMGPSENEAKRVCSSFLDLDYFLFERILPWNKTNGRSLLFESFDQAWLAHNHLAFRDECTTFNRESAYSIDLLELVFDLTDFEIVEGFDELGREVQVVSAFEVLEWIRENIKPENIGWKRGEFILEGETRSTRNPFPEFTITDLSDPINAERHKIKMEKLEEELKNKEEKENWNRPVLSAKDFDRFLSLKTDQARKNFIAKKFNNQSIKINRNHFGGKENG